MKKDRTLDMISKKTLVSALTISMVGSSLAGCGSAAAQPADNEIKDNETQENPQEVKSEADALLDTMDVNSSQSSEEAGKEETVYLFADSEGNVNNTLVSGWLKNPDGDVVIKDVTDLKDVVNVKGDEDFEKNGDEYLWKANGKDIYYQGTTDKVAPVTEKITYYLDGEEISPEDLAGKSGKVTIRFDYENTQTALADVNGKKEEVKVPFAVVTGMILNDRFRNISVENGRLVSDGSKNVVIGFALPGLRESLDLDSVDTDKLDMEEEIKVPDYVEVTADVENFELDMTLTVAASSADLSFDESLDFSDLDEKIDTLSDSSAQLADGTSQLADGIQTLKDSMGEFSDGVASLKDGVIAYTDGAAQLGDGINELKNGTDSLDEGAGALVDGINSLNSGTGELKNGIDSAKSGAEQLAAGINGTGGAKAGAQQLADGAAQLLAGLNGDPDDIQKNPGAVNGAMGLEAGIKMLVAGIDQATAEQLGSMKDQLLETETYYVNILLAKAGMPEATTDNVRQVAQTQIVPSNPEDPASAPLVGAILQAITNEALKGVTGALQGGLGQLAAATDISEEQLSASYLKGYQDGVNDAQEKLEQKEAEDAAPEPDANVNAGAQDGTGEDKNDASMPETAGNGEDADESEAGTDTVENETDAVTIEMETEPELIGAAYSQKSEQSAVSLANRADGKYVLVSLDDADMDEKRGNLPGNIDLSGILTGLTSKLQGAFDQAEKAAASVGDIQGAVMAIEQVLDQVDATEKELLENPTSERSDIKQLLAGAAQLTQGMQALSAGAKQLAEGTAQLNAGIDQLGSGATELVNGMGQLSSGSSELLDGVGKLQSGSNELKDGTSQLKDGAVQLQEGAKELNGNSGALKDGVSELYDGTGQVVDGVSELYDGADELLDGMIKFNEEGIQKIADLYQEDVKSLTDRVKAVSDAGGSYDNFCGKAEDSRSSVKFIIRTEPVKVKEAAD